MPVCGGSGRSRQGASMQLYPASLRGRGRQAIIVQSGRLSVGKRFRPSDNYDLVGVLVSSQGDGVHMVLVKTVRHGSCTHDT